MLRARVIERIEELEALRPEWDALAVAAGRPFATPSWLLAWWHHARPPTAALRTPVVLDDGELVGIMPCFAQRERPGFIEYRLLGAGSAHRIDPLARAGMEADAARLVAGSVAGSRPGASTLRLEGIDASSPWPRLLTEFWDGRIRPWIHLDVVHAAPTLSLDSDFEGWLASKSQNFRKDMRRKRRRLEAEGGTIRMIDDERELAGALDAMLRVHHVRWARRGGSQALGEAGEQLLRAAAPELLAEQRLRLWVIAAEEGIVGALLCVAAGGNVAALIGGFDDEWSRFSPEMLLFMSAIEDAFRRGDSIFDLGGGDYPYKRRIAEDDDPVAWFTLFPRGLRYPLARAHTLPRHSFWRARGWARDHLSPETQERLKAVLRRR